MSTERWLPINGFGGHYEVSSHGNVRRRGSHRLLHPTPNRKGYMRVTLGGRGGRTMYVHRLVLTAFIGPCPPGYQANHKNGDTGDNHLFNLEWMTPEDNIQHALKHGFMGQGETHPNAKLSADDVHEIRRCYASGNYTQAELGEQFHVSDVIVSGIVHGRSWTHLDGAIPDQVDQIAKVHQQQATAKGSQHHNAKLIEGDVLEMRRLYLSGNWTLQQLGDRYGVTDVTVSGIVHGESWTHVGGIDQARAEQIAEQHQAHVDRRGERNSQAKLTAHDVRKIRRLYTLGADYATLAEAYGVTPATIGHIVTRKTWKHID